MKSIVLIENQKLEIADREIPKILSNECLVNISHVGVCSSDIARAFSGGAYHYPLVMGHEMSGVVTQCGSDTTKQFKPGDRVAIYPLIPCKKCEQCNLENYIQCSQYDYYGSRRDGGLSEFLAVRAENLIQIPKDVPLEYAALLEPVSVALHAVKKIKLTNNKNEKVCILGAGILGLVSAQILRKLYSNTQIVIVDRNQFKLNYLSSNTFNKIQLENRNSFEQWTNENESQFDAVIEAIGTPQTFTMSTIIAKAKARVIWMGNINADLNLNTKQVSQILRKEIAILGTWNSDFFGPQNDWKESIHLIQNGLNLENLITQKAGFSEYVTLLNQLHQHKIGQSKFESIKAVFINDRIIT